MRNANTQDTFGIDDERESLVVFGFFGEKGEKT